VYLKKIRLQNIKCFADVELEFPVRDGSYGGWNVLLGENGRGKSTILQSIALGVLEPVEALFALEQHEGQFARQGAEGQPVVTTDLVFHTAELPQMRGSIASHQRQLTIPLQESSSQHGSPSTRLVRPSAVWARSSGPEDTISHALCYGYGPFRRLKGSPLSLPSAFQFPKSLSRFVTLFTDEIGLADATRGLIDLYVASVDPKHTFHQAAKQTLRSVKKVVDALLPGGVHLDSVTSEKVLFKTAPGVKLTEKELSDGYRSFLAIVFDLLRHFSARFGSAFTDMIRQAGGSIVINVEAVVLIDEADAHLHPSWQRELGERFQRVFPKIQFIVTTHSPFIAQEATDHGLFVLRPDADGTVTVDQPVESVRGWTASQILTSPLFGLESTRDPETESLIREQAALTAKERAGTLTTAERSRLATVRQQLSATLSAPGETYDEMRRQQDMADYVDQTLNRLKNRKK
jgi:predicted ATP-binding protein involved in virulence